MALKVLLADDSAPAQNMGKKILMDCGYEVVACSNGLEAMRKIADFAPNLAILDIFMPGYTGLEICAHLRENPATAALPVILTVGKLEPYRPEDGQQVRSNAIIVKPFVSNDLIAAVRGLIGAPSSAAREPVAAPSAAAVQAGAAGESRVQPDSRRASALDHPRESIAARDSGLPPEAAPSSGRPLIEWWNSEQEEAIARSLAAAQELRNSAAPFAVAPEPAQPQTTCGLAQAAEEPSEPAVAEIAEQAAVEDAPKSSAIPVEAEAAQPEETSPAAPARLESPAQFEAPTEQSRCVAEPQDCTPYPSALPAAEDAREAASQALEAGEALQPEEPAADPLAASAEEPGHLTPASESSQADAVVHPVPGPAVQIAEPQLSPELAEPEAGQNQAAESHASVEAPATPEAQPSRREATTQEPEAGSAAVFSAAAAQAPEPSTPAASALPAEPPAPDLLQNAHAAPLEFTLTGLEPPETELLLPPQPEPVSAPEADAAAAVCAVPSSDTERIRQAVEKVWERFRPSIIEAVQRELAGKD